MGECHNFEAPVMNFSKNELVPEVLANMLATFIMIDKVMKKIPALSIISG